jgi:phospholipase/lecithinase/hemolysin
MLKKLIIFIAIITGFAACNPRGKSAANYNNSIIEKENSLQPDVEATENNVAKYFNAANYDSIAVAGERMEGIVQKKIDEINAMPTPDAKNIGSFKAAVIEYFRFIKSLYTDYKEYGLADTEEKRMQVALDIQKIVNRKQEALDDLQSAQRKFAEANGFRLQKK